MIAEGKQNNVQKLNAISVQKTEKKKKKCN